ncbi:hypothetical protein EGM97_14590 [Pseudomonas sp. AF32]|nr:hypothetical protein [Pseudomonas sp. AF32]
MHWEVSPDEFSQLYPGPCICRITLGVNIYSVSQRLLSLRWWPIRQYSRPRRHKYIQYILWRGNGGVEFCWGRVKKGTKKGDRFIFHLSATLKASKDTGSKYAKNGAYCFTELPASHSTARP